MKKVLVIEDDHVFRLLLKNMLTIAEMEVVTAHDGAEGLELFQAQQFDLVITDIIMPVMEGLETIMELKKLDPKIKIIAISGGGQIEPEKYLSTAKALKVNAVLKKPFAYRELLEVLVALK